MLILTRREGEAIQVGDTITVIVSKITQQRVRIDIAMTDGAPVEVGSIRLEHGGFLRRYYNRGDIITIGGNIRLTICTKHRTPSQIAIGIEAPKAVNIARTELLQRSGVAGPGGLARFAAIGMLLVMLTGCAHGRELNGSWMLTVGRFGTCRIVEHRADTDQLQTRTVWRGEGCAAVQGEAEGERAALEVSP